MRHGFAVNTSQLLFPTCFFFVCVETGRKHANENSIVSAESSQS